MTNNKLTNMTLLKIFVIKDTKANIYHTPFFNRSNEVAMRMVGATANDESSLLNQYPQDYELQCIGHFDDTSGKILPLDETETTFVTNIYSLIKKED